MKHSGSRALAPQTRSVRTGGVPREVNFSADLLKRHHLYVARTRMGKSTKPDKIKNTLHYIHSGDVISISPDLPGGEPAVTRTSSFPVRNGISMPLSDRQGHYML